MEKSDKKGIEKTKQILEKASEVIGYDIEIENCEIYRDEVTKTITIRNK